MSYDPAEHTIDEVQAYLAEHPDETAAVLDAERARGDSARSTLVASLEAQTQGAPEDPEKHPDDGGDDDDGDVPVDHVEDPNLFPPGEYPEEGITGYKVEETPAE